MSTTTSAIGGCKALEKSAILRRGKAGPDDTHCHQIESQHGKSKSAAETYVCSATRVSPRTTSSSMQTRARQHTEAHVLAHRHACLPSCKANPGDQRAASKESDSHSPPHQESVAISRRGKRGPLPSFLLGARGHLRHDHAVRTHGRVP